MSGPVEAPTWAELIDLPIEVSVGDEPWEKEIRLRAGDGDEVVLGWDEIAASFYLTWSSSLGERVSVARESLFKVAADAAKSGVEIRLWFRDSDLGGSIVVRVDESVSIRDVLLLQ